LVVPVSRSAVALATVVALLVVAAPAGASELVARNGSQVELEVNGAGTALVSYTQGRARKHVLAWGAIDALTPDAGRAQVSFQLDYTGGRRSRGKAVWKTFRDRCGPYSGPPLPWLVVACTAPDGSHWALQSWQRVRPFHGKPPSKPVHDAFELRLSHWTGELARLEVWQDWKYSARFESLFGRVTYRGAPVTHPPRGSGSWQSYIRRAYIDTLDSGYGPGWWRADAYSAHPPHGMFCAIFAENLTDRFGTNRAVGARYRVTVVGPGVTPDVVWEGASLGPWNPNDPAKAQHEAAMNDLIRQLGDPDPRCAEL
jgi:hypothetical protein